MIVEYFRPKTVSEALSLVEREDVKTVYMGGGTAIDRFTVEPLAVVDLQELGLNKIKVTASNIEVGATATLQSLYEQTKIQNDLKEAIYREATRNLRQVATVAGTIVAADGRSPFITTLLGLDAVVTVMPDQEQIDLGDLLALRSEKFANKLIMQVTLPLKVDLAFGYIARTPADTPIVCVAVARWLSGRSRITVGGSGDSPVLVMDGNQTDADELAMLDVYQPQDDQWATTEYRRAMSRVLVKRCLSKLDRENPR